MSAIEREKERERKREREKKTSNFLVFSASFVKFDSGYLLDNKVCSTYQNSYYTSVKHDLLQTNRTKLNIT
jgi:hypothetical protein